VFEISAAVQLRDAMSRTARDTAESFSRPPGVSANELLLKRPA